jgi:hypothetical protein
MNYAKNKEGGANLTMIASCAGQHRLKREFGVKHNLFA